MSFFKKLFSKNENPIPTIDGVTFDTTDLELFEDEKERRSWYTPANDGIALLHFPIRPDVPSEAKTEEDFRAFYEKILGDQKVGILDIELPQINGVQCVWVVSKVNVQIEEQMENSLAFMGSLIIPFQTCSYVFKIQCLYTGLSGSRETIVWEMKYQEGQAISGEEFVSSNIAYEQKYDEMFPEHPLSRLRETYKKLIPTVRLGSDLKKLKPFYSWQE